jgi:surface protein
MKHNNESIRELIKKANDKGWINDELNRQIIEADVSQVTDMSKLFYNKTTFNLDISNWDVSSVSNMYWMFHIARNFNQDIGSWNVSNVTNMSSMFCITISFNQDISAWDLSSVTNIKSMFYRAESFNRDISKWNVSSVNDMMSMFRESESFNQDISNWDVSNVTNMRYMFREAKNFNQDISAWYINKKCNSENFLTDSGMSEYNRLLIKITNSHFNNEDLNLNKGTRINREIVKKMVIDLQDKLRDNLKDTKPIEQYRLISNYKKTVERFEHRYPGISKDIKSLNDIEL